LEELDRAIQTVWRGESYISTRVPPSTNRVAMDATHAALAALTPRQHEIIRMVADGLTSTEIAKRLGLSERTVAFHRTNIRAKLGIESDGGLLRYALLLRLNGD
jgi:DNA-binding NarL/FixJ family response regulator